MIKMFLVNICLLMITAMSYSLKCFGTPPIWNCNAAHYCTFMMVVSWNLAHSGANLRFRTQNRQHDDARCKGLLVTTTCQARGSGSNTLW